MDKPKCRVCGARHWSNEAHKFDNAKGADAVAQPRARREGAADGVSLPDQRPGDGEEARGEVPENGDKSARACPKCGVDLGLVKDGKKWRKRRAKQREYMKQKRRQK